MKYSVRCTVFVAILLSMQSGTEGNHLSTMQKHVTTGLASLTEVDADDAMKNEDTVNVGKQEHQLLQTAASARSFLAVKVQMQSEEDTGHKRESALKARNTRNMIKRSVYGLSDGMEPAERDCNVANKIPKFDTTTKGKGKLYSSIDHTDELGLHSLRKRDNLAHVFGNFAWRVPEVHVVEMFAGPGVHINRDIKEGQNVIPGSTLILLQVCCKLRIICNFHVSDIGENIVILGKVFHHVAAQLPDRDNYVLGTAVKGADNLVQSATLTRLRGAYVFFSLDPYGFQALPLTLAAGIQAIAQQQNAAVMLLNYFCGGGHFRHNGKMEDFDFTAWLGVRSITGHGPLQQLCTLGTAAFVEKCGMQGVTTPAEILSGEREKLLALVSYSYFPSETAVALKIAQAVPLMRRMDDKPDPIYPTYRWLDKEGVLLVGGLPSDRMKQE